MFKTDPEAGVSGAWRAGEREEFGEFNRARSSKALQGMASYRMSQSRKITWSRLDCYDTHFLWNVRCMWGGAEAREKAENPVQRCISVLGLQQR